MFKAIFFFIIAYLFVACTSIKVPYVKDIDFPVKLNSNQDIIYQDIVHQDITKNKKQKSYPEFRAVDNKKFYSQHKLYKTRLNKASDDLTIEQKIQQLNNFFLENQNRTVANYNRAILSMAKLQQFTLPNYLDKKKFDKGFIFNNYQKIIKEKQILLDDIKEYRYTKPSN